MFRGNARKAIQKVRGRLLREGEPDAVSDWQSRYRSALLDHTPEEVLLGHERSDILDHEFNVGAYLVKNQDVSDVVASPGEAAYHYLEFGFSEGRNAKPQRWDPAFVRVFHGHDLPETLTACQANHRLRQSGVSLSDSFLTEAQFWQAHATCGPMLEGLMVHELYAVEAEARGFPLPSRDRISAIKHFLDVGLREVIAPHPDHRFDPDFYRECVAVMNPSAAPSGDDPESLFRHWARVGLRAGCHANPFAWVRHELKCHLPQTVLENLEGFRKASQKLKSGATRAATLHQLSKSPMPGLSGLDLNAPETLDFCVALAHFLHEKSKNDTAIAVLELVLSVQHDHPSGCGLMAHLMAIKKRHVDEIEYRQRPKHPIDNGSNQIALALRLLEDDRLLETLDVLDALPETIDGNVGLRNLRQSAAETTFSKLWGGISKMLKTEPVEDIQSLLSRALQHCTPRIDVPLRSNAIRRIAVLANEDLYQCKLYRADQKIDQLRHAGFEAQIFAKGRDVELLRSQLEQFDAVIFMRVPAFPPIINVIAQANQLGLATFYDCDDLIFDTALFPPPIETYSGTITETDHAAIACGVPLFRHAMSLCTYGIASTPTIQNAMKDVVQSGQVFLHRNALGKVHERARARQENANSAQREKLVLYYGSGTKAHKRAFHEILEPALARVLDARRGQVEIRIVGDFADFKHLRLDDPDVSLVPPIWDFESFCALVAEADINLSVLEPGIITDAKSEIKWMEAAMFGVPSIVSPTATYRDVIRDNETGLMREDAAEFEAALLELIDDVDLREQIGTAAQENVLRSYGLDALGENFKGMFEAVRPKATVRKPRILCVNVFYPPQDVGGATRVMQDNVRAFTQRYSDRYEVDVVCTLQNGTTPYEVTSYARDGARVWAITNGPGISLMDPQDHAMADVFDRLLGKISPDLVHFHCIQHLTTSVVDAVQSHNIPYIVTLHDGWWVSPNHFIQTNTGVRETYNLAHGSMLPDRARITKRCLDGADALLAVSEAFADVHRSAGLTSVRTVENGISELPRRVSVTGRSGRVRLGHIGGAARHKGYHLIRAAFEAQKFQNIDLVILDHAMPVGQSRSEDWNGTPVTFQPRVPLDRVGEIYGQIDVLLAPSTWPESYGLVTREALALGLWVIASDQGAIGQDVVNGETGFVVPVSDHRGLADAISKVDQDPEKYCAPPTVRPNIRTSDEQADDLVEIYDRILAGRRQ